MPVGAFTGFVNGVDPSGAVSPDAGSSRKFIHVQVWESTVDPNATLDIGDVVATEWLRRLEGNIGIELRIWNEAAIASWADNVIDYADSASLGDQSHGWFTITDVDQANLGTRQDADSGAAIDNVILDTVSSAADDILAISLDASKNRAAHIHGDVPELIQRMEFSVTAYSGRLSYGAGGGDRALAITLTNDLFATSAFAGVTAVFAPSSAVDPVITSLSGDPLAQDSADVVTGTGFEAVPGTVKISPTDNVADAGAVVQTITDWADDSIDYVVVRGALNLDDTLYLFVTNDSGDSNAAGIPVVLTPNTTLNFYETPSVMLTINLSFIENAITIVVESDIIVGSNNASIVVGQQAGLPLPSPIERPSVVQASSNSKFVKVV